MRYYINIATLISLFTLMIPAPAPVAAAERTLLFSGRVWTARAGGGGPGPNNWAADADAVFVDAQGRLHLKIVNRNGVWYSSEVRLPSSLGYGTYTFDIASRVDQEDSNSVSSPFIYEDDQHEIDIEFADWKSPGYPKGNYTVQPGWVAGNHRRFDIQLADGVSRHQFIWSPQSIIFKSTQNGRVLQEWTYAGQNNFAPGNERLLINHWLIGGTPPTDGQEKDFIVQAVTFTPLGATPAAQPSTPNSPPSSLVPTPAPAPVPALAPAPKPRRVPAPAAVPIPPSTPAEPTAPAPVTFPTYGGYYLSCIYHKFTFAWPPYVYYERRCEYKKA